jgi:hypothetical protein
MPESGSSESGGSEDENEDGAPSTTSPVERASKQQRRVRRQASCDDNEQRRFLREGMIEGVLDGDEESAAEVLSQLNDKSRHGELQAEEMREFCTSFFKRKDIRASFDKKDEYGNKIFKYQSYLKEFLVYHHFIPGADPYNDDEECTDDLKTYLDVVGGKGKDASGEKMDCPTAKQFRFLATAQNLEDFLRDYFIKFRQR